MREIIFDTETTGLDNKTDRIIEIGCVELENRFPTGRTLHIYINPDGQRIHPDAQAIHGISEEFLRDKPVFAAVANEILEFFEGGSYVAHNASFDMGFLNAEFARLGIPAVMPDLVIDSLTLARRRHPMGPNSLDALCRRYGIDNSHRTRHGALLDAELLADVYIEMLGGRQAVLGLVPEVERSEIVAVEEVAIGIGQRPHLLPSRLAPADLEAHERLVERLGDKSLWARFQQKGP